MDFPAGMTNGEMVRAGFKHADFLFKLFEEGVPSSPEEATRRLQEYLEAQPNYAAVFQEIETTINMLRQINVAVKIVTMLIVVERKRDAQRN